MSLYHIVLSGFIAVAIITFCGLVAFIIAEGVLIFCKKLKRMEE